MDKSTKVAIGVLIGSIAIGIAGIAYENASTENRKIDRIKVGARCSEIKGMVLDTMIEASSEKMTAKELEQYNDKFIKAGVITSDYKAVSMALWEKRDAWINIEDPKLRHKTTESVFNIVCIRVL